MNKVNALLLAILVSIPGAARADDEDMPLADSPAAVQKTIKEEAKGFAVEDVTKETDDDGKVTFWAQATIDGKVYDIGVAEDGTLVDLALMLFEDDELSFADAPEAVRKTFKDEAKGAAVETLTRERRLGVPVYVAGVGINGKAYEIKVAEDGTLVEKVLSIEESDVELADCPPAVQKTLQEHSRGGDLGDITRSAGIDRRVYSAEVTAGGKTWFLEVDEAGVLIAKSLDEGG
jgi:hypothetical protein